MPKRCPKTGIRQKNISTILVMRTADAIKLVAGLGIVCVRY